MSTPSFGDVDLMFVWGRVDTVEGRVEDISRPGVDGHGYAAMGERGEVSTLTGLADDVSASDCEAKFEALKALVGGDPVTVTYGDGETVENVQVLGVRKRPLPGAPGGVKLVANAWGSAMLTVGEWLLGVVVMCQHRGA